MNELAQSNAGETVNGGNVVAAVRVLDVYDKIFELKDAEGKPIKKTLKWVKYQTRPGDPLGSVLEESYSRLIDPGDSDDFTDPGVQYRRETASAIAAQVAARESGQGSSLPAGHYPIERWGALQPLQIAALKNFNIVSCQQYAGAQAHIISQLPGSLSDPATQNQCRAFLAMMQDSQAGRTIAEMEDKYSRLEGLLEAALRKLEDVGAAGDAEPAKRGPGRPRRVDSEAEAA